jgi:hypothetical protein
MGQTEAEKHAVAVLAALSIVLLAVEVMQAQNSGSGKKWGSTQIVDPDFWGRQALSGAHNGADSPSDF